MEEPELEEGEAYYDKDDTSIDPDISLSYIGEKLQSVLGHLQKDFEGGVPLESLGAKYGGYGSFLPTHQRSPAIRSQPKTPPRVQNYNTSRSLNNFPVECAPQNANSDASLPQRLGTASHSLHSLQNSEFLTGDVSAKHNSHLMPAQVAKKSSLKHEPSLSRSVNPTDQKKLRVRIKVGSDSATQKNAAIYSGLGLISPSSSMGNSPEKSGGVPFESQETPDETPASILQTMTSFPVFGGLLSPLQDSLLCLMRKQKFSDCRTAPTLTVQHGDSTISADNSSSMLGDGEVLKVKKLKSGGKSDVLKGSKHGNGIEFENNMTSVLNKDIENDIRECKQYFSNQLKTKPLSNSTDVTGNSVKGAVMAPVVSRDVEKGVPVKKRHVDKDRAKDRLMSDDLIKDDSLESISGQKVSNYEHQDAKSSSVEKIGDQVRSFHKDNLVDWGEGGRNKCDRVSAPLKADSDVSKCGKGSDTRVMNHFKEKVGMKARSHEQDGKQLPHGSKNLSLEGKNKSKESQSNGQMASDLAEESSKSDVCPAPKDKTNAKKDMLKVRDSNKDMLDTRAEHTDNQMVSLERYSGNRVNDNNCDDVKNRHQFADKPKERSRPKKVDNESTSETLLKEAPRDVLPSAKGLFSEMELGPVAPVYIEEDWVCCDRCQTWRLLPYGTKPEQLPEKWLCSMLNWLPGMNRCDISEEETSQALRALYLLPAPDSQNNLKNNADRTALGVPSADGQFLDQNFQNLSSDVMPNRGKKKNKSKGTFHAAINGELILNSNVKKNLQQETGKGRSLNDLSQPPPETNLISKSKTHHLLSNLTVEKHSRKQKGKHREGGESKQKKLKNNREDDQCASGTKKKIKTESLHDNYEDWNSEHDRDLGKLGLGSGAGFPTLAAGQCIQRHNVNIYPKDAKHGLKNSSPISVKKQGDSTQLSSDSKSSGMKKCDEREIYPNKRKIKDRQDIQNHTEALQSNGNHLAGSKVHVMKENDDFRKAKKPRGKESNNGEDRLNKKGGETRILLSGRDNPDDSRVKKDQHPRKYIVKVSSHVTLDDIGSLKRDLGSEQCSKTATSSSSKVSDSRKSRANFQEIKGSPVESVSSSPLRNSNPDKLLPTRKDYLGKDDGKHGGFPVRSSPRKSRDGDGNYERAQFGVASNKEASFISHLGSDEFPVLDFGDSDATHKVAEKAESTVKLPSGFGNCHVINSNPFALERHSSSPTDIYDSNQSHNEYRMNKNHLNTVPFPSKKSGKSSSYCSKDKGRNSGPIFDRIMEKFSDSRSEHEDMNPNKGHKDEVSIDPHPLVFCEELGNAKNQFSDKCGTKSRKDGKFVAKKGYGKWAGDSRKENQPKFVGKCSSDVNLGALNCKDERVTLQHNLIKDFEDEVRKKSEETGLASRDGKSEARSCDVGKRDPVSFVHQPLPGSQKGSGLDVQPTEISGDVDASKVLKQPRSASNQNGTQRGIEHLVPVTHEVGDPSVPSHLTRDTSNQTVANALKEAEELKDYADRLKNSGFGFECNEAYFQAALKFLHGASLIENCNNENSKHGEMTQMQIYSSTAQLCKICAHEYEKRHEMAAAALAYKCMEVAYMRVVYCKNSSTNRDWHDLQASLQMAPQGESPSSSSASDIDNLNNQGTVDKAALSKAMGSNAGNHVITSRNHPNFVRLLDFTKDVNSAMEASRKSQNAFAAANVILEEAHNKEGIISVKRVIDFSFQEVEELIRLVRLAIEAISRHGFHGNKE